jgi:hypothetical protein
VRAGSGSGTDGYESVNLRQAIAAWRESSNLVPNSVKKLFQMLDEVERHREHADLGEATECRYGNASSRTFFLLTGFLDLALPRYAAVVGLGARLRSPKSLVSECRWTMNPSGTTNSGIRPKGNTDSSPVVTEAPPKTACSGAARSLLPAPRATVKSRIPTKFVITAALHAPAKRLAYT